MKTKYFLAIRNFDENFVLTFTDEVDLILFLMEFDDGTLSMALAYED